MTFDNCINSQRVAQKVLTSNKMFPPSIREHLLKLQKQANVDFSKLINIVDGFMSFMSGEEHKEIKVALAQPMGKKNLLSYEETIQKTGAVLVGKLQQQREGNINLVNDIETPLFLTIVKEIFGFQPENDEALLKDINIAVYIIEPMQSIKMLLQIESAFERIIGQISKQIVLPGSTGLIKDIHSALLNTRISDNSIEKIAIVITNLLIASRTTTETLSNIIIANKDLSAKECEKFADVDWVKDNLSGLVRLCGSAVYLTRTASEDVCFDEIKLQKNDNLLIHLPSANRDGSYYQNCDYSHLDQSPKQRSIAFGGGIHRCPGEQLALMTLTVVLPILYQNFPNIEVDINKVEYMTTRLAIRLISAPATLNRVNS
ncbi:hypothetical protein B6N13_02155 [Marinomonas sp. UCMA 3892]|uniref:cytochrome P450 n=1 Tax=Marinomonas sp. UCMA 3892 TaxID=1972585 RepID=UPI00146F16E2|nr:cytochrome P450 [Marinomonas sp. UCMA 3892]NLU96901.1 hypothetical protein [Marinomonas sp. UCMA 3892]